MSDSSSGSSVYDILAFVFDRQDTAKQTLDDIKSSGALDGFEIQAQCIAEQDAKGKVHIHAPARVASALPSARLQAACWV